MERRNQIIFGAVGSVLAIVFIALLVRSCGRQDFTATSRATGTGGGGTVAVGSVEGTSPNMDECEADPQTGLCFPRSSNVVADTLDMDNFVANIVQLSSSSGSGSSVFRFSSSSSSRLSFFGRSASSRSSSAHETGLDAEDDDGTSVVDRILRRSRSSSVAAALGRSSRSSSSNNPLAPGFVPTYMAEASAATHIIGRASSSRSSRGGGSTSGRNRGGTGSGGSGGTGSGGSGGTGSGGNGGNSGGSIGGGTVIVGGGSGGGAGGGGSGVGGGGGGVSFNHYCDRSRSLLSIFDFGEMTTGREGWTFPVLLNGDCPITAAMIKVDKSGGFGGPLDDF